MKELANNLSSIYWWVSVVVVGILINLFSAYFKDKLDAFLSNISSRWQKKSEAEKNQRLREIERLRDNTVEQILFAHSITKQQVGSVLFSIWGLLFLVFSVALYNVYLNKDVGRWEENAYWAARTFCRLICAICMFISVREYSMAEGKNILLIDSRTKIDSKTAA